ncbi:hypothetical protein HPG69_004503 [Diceros bicornis minor]|uniref:Uncharacterized protein n=1 Tax=Diceros bicornis minor TaxID=77932 RepID=A0A7J7F9E9_DICBM|nr:hypothetical protein HPG69_004503 [Diceros bicornis minor]
MEDQWVNMGQEKLRPYRELPCGNRGPRVRKVRMNMVFEWDKGQDSLGRRRYDNVVAMYLILSSKEPEVEGHTGT